MRFIHAAQSSVGRIVQGALGAWLLIEGTAQSSLAGLVMMMTGVVLAVTGLAGLGLGEHEIDARR
jgi:uncharacterized membrane protein